MDIATLETGIIKYRAGNRARAREIFIEVLIRELQNTTAWLWLAGCVLTVEDRIACFRKALALDPGNTAVQQALDIAQQQVATHHLPVPASELGFNCPRCGSELGPLNPAGWVKCNVCGTSLTIDPMEAGSETIDREKFLELCQSALNGRAYAEALRYANKVLEIDPVNIRAWINKAIATNWLTNESENRFEEAMGYLSIAENLDKDDPLIEATRQRLRQGQSGWYTHLGDQADAMASKIMDDYAALHLANMDDSEPRAHSQEYIIKAMNYYLLASNFDPGDLTPVYKMKYLAKLGDWLIWPAEVRTKIASLAQVEKKDKVSMQLTGLQRQLQAAQARLETVERQKGVFVGMRVADVKRNIAALKQQIASLEDSIGS